MQNILNTTNWRNTKQFSEKKNDLKTEYKKS